MLLSTPSRSLLRSTSKMPVALAYPTAAEATSDTARPHVHYVHKPADVPAPASAVPPPPPEYAAAVAAHATRPPVISEQALHPMCFAYARLTPPSRNPGADIVRAIDAAALGLCNCFTLHASAHGTMGVRFHTPADREAAMRLQPFAHDGVTVELVRGWETAVLDDYLIDNLSQHQVRSHDYLIQHVPQDDVPQHHVLIQHFPQHPVGPPQHTSSTTRLVRCPDDDYLLHNISNNLVRSPDDLLVHVALHRYPAEQRTEREIGANCRGFGWVIEVDQACFAAPDLATVHVVLCVGHTSEIPRELHIVYADRSTSIVPMEILGVCDWSAAFRDHGRYVRFFQQPQDAAAPADLLGSRVQAISLS